MSRRLSASRQLRIALLIASALLMVIAGEVLLSSSMYKNRSFDGKELGTMPDPGPDDRIVVFAPHPDDEVIGAGAYIQRAIKNGAEVKVVLMTNGEYPELSLLLAEKTITGSKDDYIKLGYIRQSESLDALELLGLDPENVIFLGYPDHMLNRLWTADHWNLEDALKASRTGSYESPYDNSFTEHAVHCGRSVLDDVRKVLEDEEPTVVVVVNPYDIHVDHWATYAFAISALAELKARDIPVLPMDAINTYLVHWPEWPVPRGYRPSDSQVPPRSFARLDQYEWHAFPAGILEVLLKRQALRSYRSQLSSWNPFLSSFVRANEAFAPASKLNWYIGPGTLAMDLPDEAKGDTVACLRNPGSDITDVVMQYEDGMLTMEIQTAGSITSASTFGVTICEVGRGSGGIEITGLSLSLTGIAGSRTEDGIVSALPKEKLAFATEAGSYFASFPFEPKADQGFMVVRVWSYMGTRTIDQTNVSLIEYYR